MRQDAAERIVKREVVSAGQLERAARRTVGAVDKVEAGHAIAIVMRNKTLKDIAEAGDRCFQVGRGNLPARGEPAAFDIIVPRDGGFLRAVAGKVIEGG